MRGLLNFFIFAAVIFFCSFCGATHFGEAEKRAFIIFQKLQGIVHADAELQIIPGNKQPEAIGGIYSDIKGERRKIIMGEDNVNSYSEDTLAFVIAHELHHTKQTPLAGFPTIRGIEKDADIRAIEYIHSSGFNMEKAISGLRGFLNPNGDISHYPRDERIQYLTQHVNLLLGKPQPSRPLSTPRPTDTLGEPQPGRLPQASYKDGVLLKGSRPEVYVIQGGRRSWIPDPATFKAKGYDWNKIKVIPDEELDRLPRGPDVRR